MGGVFCCDEKVISLGACPGQANLLSFKMKRLMTDQDPGSPDSP
jgi:hypothetical protein